MNGEPVEQDSRNLNDYLPILRRRKWLILGPFLAGLLGAAGWNLMSTPIYEATATLQVGPLPFTSFLSGDRQPAYIGWMFSSQPFDSEIQVLRSRTLAEEAVKRLQARGPLEGDQFAQAVNDLQTRIRVNFLRSTNILVVAAQSSVPEAAAREANALSEAYVAHTAQRRTSALSVAEEFVGRQLELVGEKLRTIQESLKGYRAKRRTPTTASETVLEKIIAADVRKAKLEAERKEVGALLDFVKQPKPGTPPGPFVLMTPTSSPLIHETFRRLGELEIRRAKLRTMFTEQHPEVISLDIEAKQLKARLIQEVEAMVQALKVREQNLIEIIGQHEAELKRFPDEEVNVIEFLRSAKVTEEMHAFFLKKQEEARLAVGFSQVGDARILDRAFPPRVPILPNTRRRLQLGGILGLLLGVGLAFVRERLDRSVRTIEDLEKRVGLPVFGAIPAIAASRAEGWRSTGGGAMFPLFIQIEQRAPAFEAYRSLRTNIQFAVPEARTKCFLFTSPGAEEGKTLTAANLAVALACKGARVLLVDADLRKPILHRVFRVPQEPGLSDLLIKQLEWQDQVRPTEVENLELLPSGLIPPNPSEILESNRAKLLLQELAQHYDVILIDTPPILPATDAAVLGAMVDGVFLMARARTTTPKALLRARALLQAANVRVLGTILNAVRPEDDGDYYYYYDSVEGEVGRKNRWLRLKRGMKLRKEPPPPKRDRLNERRSPRRGTDPHDFRQSPK